MMLLLWRPLPLSHRRLSLFVRRLSRGLRVVSHLLSLLHGRAHRLGRALRTLQITDAQVRVMARLVASVAVTARRWALGSSVPWAPAGSADDLAFPGARRTAHRVA